MYQQGEAAEEAISIEATPDSFKLETDGATFWDLAIVLVLGIVVLVIARNWLLGGRRGSGGRFMLGFLLLSLTSLHPAALAQVPSGAVWARVAYRPDHSRAFAWTSSSNSFLFVEGDAAPQGVFVGPGIRDECEVISTSSGALFAAISHRDPASNGNVYMALQGAWRGPGDAAFGAPFFVDNGSSNPAFGQSNWRPLLSRGRPGRVVLLGTFGWGQHVGLVEIFGEGSVGAPLIIEANSNPRNVAGNAARVGANLHLVCWSEYVLPNSILVRVVNLDSGGMGPVLEVTPPGHGAAIEPRLSRWPGERWVWCSWSEGGQGRLALLDRLGRRLLGPVSTGAGTFARVEALPGGRCTVAWDRRSGGQSEGRAGFWRIDGREILPDGPNFRFQGPEPIAFGQEPPAPAVSFGGEFVSYGKSDKVVELAIGLALRHIPGIGILDYPRGNVPPKLEKMPPNPI